MHKLSIPAELIESVTRRAGRAHPFDVLDPAKTAFVVVDMQNYFMHPDYQGEVPMAREVVPHVNRLAAAIREAGGHVVWVKNATNDTRESWSVFHDWLMTPERRDRRYATMDTAHEGHALWPLLDVKPQDAQIVKKRFSRLHSGLVRHRQPSARPRHRHRADRRHRHQRLLRKHSPRRHDAELQGGDGARRPRHLHRRGSQRHAADIYSIFGDVQTVDEAIASLKRGLADEGRLRRPSVCSSACVLGHGPASLRRVMARIFLRWPRPINQLILMSACLITLCHLMFSTAMNFSNSAGPAASTTKLRASSAFLTSGRASTSATSAWILSTDFARRAGRRKQAERALRGVAGDAGLLHGRNVRRQRVALDGRNRQRLELCRWPICGRMFDMPLMVMSISPERIAVVVSLRPCTAHGPA